MIRKTRGFTLVELLIIVSVLGVLATVITLGAVRIMESSRDSQRASSVSVLSEALEKYYVKNGRYPSCSALQGSPDAVQQVLDIDKGIIKAPSNNAVNSISCSDITSSTSTDTYAYIGDGSSQCNSGGGCLSYTLKYKSEANGEIVALESRKTAFSPTSGAITLQASATSSTAVSLTWNPVTSAAEYEIQRATNASFTTGLATSVHPNPNYTVTGLTMGVTYHFRIKAVDRLTNTLGLSNAVSVTTPVPTPTGLAVTTNSMSQITARWNAVSGASSYRLQYATASNFSNATTLSNITTTNRAVTGLTEATVYYFRVYAVANSTASSASGSVNTRTAVRAPSGVGATTNSSTQVTVNWNSVLNASSYRVEYSTASNFSNATLINNITGTSRAVTGLSPATLYYFRVYAVAGNSVSLASSSVSTRTAVPTPTGVSATTNSVSQVTVNWNAVTNATSYRVEYATASNFSNAITLSNITSTNRAVTGLSEATLYYFRVYAVAGSTVSLASNSVNTRTAVRAPTGVSATTNSSTQVTVNWNAVTNATSYRVEYATASNFSNAATISNITGTSRAVGGLSPATVYYFRVYAVAGSTVSLASSSVSTRTAVPTPTGVTATANSTTQITVTWNASTNATSYRLEYATASNFSNSTTVTGLTSRTRAVTGLSPATVYYFRVYAVAGSTVSLASSSANTRTGIAAPTGLQATTSSNTQIATSWNAVSGASSYRLEYSTTSNFANVETLNGITGTSRTVGSLAQGDLYYFRVFAVVSSTTSVASNRANATTTIATPAVPTLSNSTSGSTTTWAIGSVSCVSGTTTQYRYRYTLENNTPNAWTGATSTKPSPTWTTSSQGWRYEVETQARCQTSHTTSDWSGARSSTYTRPVSNPGGTSFNHWRGDWRTVYMSGTSSCGTGATLEMRADVYTYDWQWTPFPPNRYGWYRTHFGSWVTGELANWGSTITTGAQSNSSQGIPSGKRYKIVVEKRCRNVSTNRSSSTLSNESPVYTF